MASATTAPTQHATITTVIVVVPDTVPSAALVSTEALAEHLGITSTPEPRFWTNKLYPWQRRDMLDLRKQAKQSRAAGGPVRHLNLAGMRHAAVLEAGFRHHQWSEVVRGTRPATPWTEYLARHLATPEKTSMEWAIAQFQAQPRVLAMNIHNAGFGPVFDVDELEALQAGAHAYATYRALRAVCGDALLTADGNRILADSDRMSDRTTYLAAAHQHLQNLDRDQRILALRV